MLKDMVNYPFGGGMSSITSGSGGPPSTDIYRRIVSGHFEIRQERRPRTVSFYIPLSKRTPVAWHAGSFTHRHRRVEFLAGLQHAEAKH